MAGKRANVGGRPATEDRDVERLQHVLRSLRDERFNGNAVELARALGLSQSAVSQLLSRRTTPSLGTVRRIAHLAKVSIGDLLDGPPFDPFPLRAQAAQIARDGGLPDAAIEAVLKEPADQDHPVLFWLKKIEMVAARRSK